MTLAAIVLAAMAGGGCVEIPGERILARDLAGAVPVFGSLPPEQPIGYAPGPGARRILTHFEIARLGPAFVAAPEVCVERASERLTAERLVPVLRAALAGVPGIRLEVLDFSRYPIPKGELEFARSGLGRPQPRGVLWRGRLRYDGNRSLPLWARVKLSVTVDQVVAVENLKAGRPIEPGQVRVERAEVFPFAERSPDNVAAVAGRLPRRSLRAGSPVLAGALAAARQVEPGDSVAVEVQSGAAQLRFDARAESAGDSGDLVSVRNPANGRRFVGRVAGENKVRVDANTVHSHNFGAAAARGGGR